MFTSRLPKSTSVRKQSYHGETGSTSTSFIGLSRPSAIPTTVRKANLFTPQTKRPFASGASTAGKSYMTTDKKYQRPIKPLPDKEQQQRMFDNLVNFIRLNAPHLPVPEAKKFFSSVSTTESARIFEFLISFYLFPEFKITRLETDVPEALKLLEYPYIRSVTKSALVSVTSRQAAVGLLVIFDWLIDLTERCIRNDESDDEEPDLVKEISKHIIEHDPSEVAERVGEKLYPPGEDSQTIKAELERYREEFAELSRKKEEIEASKERLENYEHDILVCKKHYLEYEKYVHSHLDQERAFKEESMELDQLENEAADRKSQLLLEIKNNPLDINEVRRLQAEFEDSNLKLVTLDQQRNDLQAKIEQDIKAYQNNNKSREYNEVNLRSMRELLSFHESQSDLNSEHLNQTKVELREWILRLEQAPQDDLAQMKKIEHDHMLFLEKMHASNSLVDKEIKESISEDIMQLDNIKFMKEKENSPLLREKISKVRRNIEEEKLEASNFQSQEEARSEEDDRKFAHERKRIQENKAALLEGIERETRLLEAELREAASLEEISLNNLKSVCEAKTQQVDHKIQEQESSVKRLQERRAIAEENNRIAKKYSKMIKKRL